MRSSKYTEHYTDTFITFKEIMRTVSNIYHNCVPDKIKNRRNTDQLKQRDTVIIACVIWGIINGYTSQRATYRAVCSVLFPNGDFPSRSRFTRLSSNLAYTIKIIRYFFWNGNSFFDKFYKVQNFFPYAIPIVLDNEPPRM